MASKSPHQKQKGVSTDPKARAQAARQRRPSTSTDLHASDAATPAPPPKPLVRSVRVGLVKPEEEWDVVGARLRDMDGVMHRILNAGVRAAALDDGGQASTAAAARKAVKAALAGERAYWGERVGRPFEGKNHDPEKAARMAELALPSVVEDYVASRAAKAFLDARKHMLRGDKSLPSYNRHAPIFFRDGDGAWQLRRNDRGQYELGFKLRPGRSPKTWFAVSVQGASAYADLKRMVSGGVGVKLGDAKIIRNDKIRTGPTGERRPIWEARLCYTSPAAERARGEAVVAVHRGMHQMLTLASTSGAVRIVPGEAYRQAKAGLSARRRSLAQHIRRGELGHGARGRGVRRRYQALDRLGDAEARMLKSACQQAAAAAVAFAVHEGADRIVLEDYQTISADDASRFMPTWPWAQLKGAVEWAARKAGLTIETVESAYISLKCPADGSIDSRNVDGRVFECVSCGLRRNTDTIAAFNMLSGAGLGEGPRDKYERALAAFARAVRAGEAAE